jgi:hypothetical protein
LSTCTSKLLAGADIFVYTIHYVDETNVQPDFQPAIGHSKLGFAIIMDSDVILDPQ